MNLSTSGMGGAEVPAYTPIGEILINGDIAQGGLTTLAGSVNAVPFEPKYLQDRGTYDYVGVTTSDIQLEFDGQVITVIQSSAPSTSPRPVSLRPRTVKTVSSVRIAEEVTVRADEIAAIRRTADTGFDSVPGRADREIQTAVRNIRATHEYHRLGAAMGLLLDADGTVIANYFTQLGVSQPTYDVAFGTAGSSKFIKIAMDLKNQTEDALGELGDEEPVILCGRTFFQKFITAADVVSAYQYFEAQQQKMIPTREDLRYSDFKFGGFRWRQYRGSSNNTGRFLPDNEAHIIVDSVPGTYLGFWCPPRDVESYANIPGMPIVPTVERLRHDAGIEIRLQSNPVHVMTRPAAAIKLYSTN